MERFEQFIGEVTVGRAGVALATASAGVLLLLTFRHLLWRAGERRNVVAHLVFYAIYGTSVLALFLAGPGSHSTYRRYVSLVGLLCLAFAGVKTVSLVGFDYFIALRRRVVVPVIIRDIVLALLFLVLAFVILSEHGVDLTGIVTTSAVLTGVLGLASQGVLSNVFSGLALQFERSFKLGDWIQCGTVIGVVEEIGWRSVKLRTIANEYVVIPNNNVGGQTVLNFTRPEHVRREMRLSVHFRHPPQEVKAIIQGALAEIPGVRELPPTCVILKQFAESAAVYEIRYWIDDMSLRDLIDDRIISRAWYALGRAGIEPQVPVRSLDFPLPPAPLTAPGEVEALFDKVRLFSAFAPADRRLLAAGARRQRFSAGELVMRQGERGDALYVIASGSARVRFDSQARGGGVEYEPPFVLEVGAGEVLGEISVFTGDPRNATVLAASELVAYAVDAAPIHEALRRDQTLSLRVSMLLAEREPPRRRPAANAETPKSIEEPAGERLLARIKRFLGGS